jgi:hypothetical protein
MQNTHNNTDSNSINPKILEEIITDVESGKYSNIPEYNLTTDIEEENFYTPKAKPKDIQQLIRDDYPDRFVQEFIAEYIINNEPSSSIDKCIKRFNKTMKALCGEPPLPKKERGNDDEINIHRAYYLIEKGMHTWPACEEIACSIHIKNFRIGKNIPKPKPSDENYDTVKSTTRRLYNKLKKRNIGPRKFHGFFSIQNLKDEKRLQKLHENNGMVRHWIKRYFSD